MDNDLDTDLNCVKPESSVDKDPVRQNLEERYYSQETRMSVTPSSIKQEGGVEDISTTDSTMYKPRLTPGRGEVLPTSGKHKEDIPTLPSGLTIHKELALKQRLPPGLSIQVETVKLPQGKSEHSEEGSDHQAKTLPPGITLQRCEDSSTRKSGS